MISDVWADELIGRNETAFRREMLARAAKLHGFVCRSFPVRSTEIEVRVRVLLRSNKQDAERHSMLPTQLTPLARKHTWRGVQHFEIEANRARHRDAHADPCAFFRIFRNNYVKA
jgi:hypothetical protein